MANLYLQLKEQGNFSDAYIVIKNLLSKNLHDQKLFAEFISLCLEIAMYDIVFDERKEYVSEAYSALSLFSENADMDEDVLSLIKETKQQINAVYESICKSEKLFYIAKEDELRSKNTQLLDTLSTLNQQLKTATTQHSFDTLLSKVAQIEQQLDKSLFSEAQIKTYEILTQSYSKTISEKMEELNHKSLLELNKKAVSSFKDVFETFMQNKNKYKDSESNLKFLVTTKFFIFDTSMLFNESLIYYNHIYSTIFQTVNDELKYKLTEWALNTNKLTK